METAKTVPLAVEPSGRPSRSGSGRGRRRLRVARRQAGLLDPQKTGPFPAQGLRRRSLYLRYVWEG